MSKKSKNYLQEAIDAAMDGIKRAQNPILIRIAIGTGKTAVLIGIAQWVFQSMNSDKVLVLVTNQQNKAQVEFMLHENNDLLPLLHNDNASNIEATYAAFVKQSHV